MKKLILIIATLGFVLGVYAQNTDYNSYSGFETNKNLNLTAGQIAQIKKLNREVGPKFEAIGRSNLSGYEKGQRKRELALEHKAAIRKILNEEQIKAWESEYDRMDSGEGLKDIIKDNYDERIERLEEEYERDKKIIEKSILSKEKKKTKLDILKNNYKTEKERLKEQRDKSVKSGVLCK